MHSKIIEVGTKPIPEYQWAKETMFFDGFQGWIADYVDSSSTKDYRCEIIEDFISELGGPFDDVEHLIGGDESFILRRGSKERYFNGLLKSLKAKVNDFTVKDFMRGDVKYQVETLVGDPFGLYIYEEGYGTSTLISWLGRAKEDTPYYIGGIIDYHY